MKTRQPIKEYLLSLNDVNKKITQQYEDLIKSEVNVKEIGFISEEKAKSLYIESLILNKGAIGRDFKQDRVKVEEYLEKTNLEEIKKIFLKGKLKLTLGEKKYELTKEHFQIEQTAKDPYGVKVSNYGIALINSELDDTLLREGFARDFIRNTQNIRKDLKLSRGKEKVIINIINNIDIEKELGEFIDYVKEETGCIKLGKAGIGKPFSFKIQGKEIEVMIEVIDS